MRKVSPSNRQQRNIAKDTSCQQNRDIPTQADSHKVIMQNPPMIDANTLDD